MVRARAGLAESDDEATTRTQGRATRRRVGAGRRASARWIEPALLALLGLERRPARRDELFARLAHVLRAHRRRRARSVLVFEDLHWADPGLLDFIDHLLDWTRGVPDLHRHAGPAGAARAAPGLGRRPSATSSSLAPRAAARAADARAAGGLVPGLPEQRRAPSWRAPTASRCTRSRRCACCLPRAGCVRGDGVYRPVGDLADARRARDAARAHRRAARRARAGRPGLLQDAAVLGQTSRSTRSPRSRAPADSDSSRACARSSGASCSRIDSRPALARARPVRVRPGAHPRGRLRHARRSRTARRATLPRRATSSRSATTSWPAPWRPTTWRRYRASPADPRRRHWPPRRASR